MTESQLFVFGFLQKCAEAAIPAERAAAAARAILQPTEKQAEDPILGALMGGGKVLTLGSLGASALLGALTGRAIARNSMTPVPDEEDLKNLEMTAAYRAFADQIRQRSNRRAEELRELGRI